MAHYVIGDVQGCFEELLDLTKLIKFSSINDRLIFAGDLVNRGPQSLEVLDFCLKNKNAVSGVLGNHDFYLLYLLQHGGEDSSLNKIINSSNAEEYFNWLSALPLVKNIEIKNNIFWIVHAGIPPFWKPSIAYQYSQEIEDQLKNNSKELLENIWGDHPSSWQDSYQGLERYRCIINHLTRMRYLNNDNSLNLKKKDLLPSKELSPWFNLLEEDSLAPNEYIVFGHWASLNGQTNIKNIIGLDTGCVWGGSLTALRLEDMKIFSVQKK